MYFRYIQTSLILIVLLAVSNLQPQGLYQVLIDYQGIKEDLHLDAEFVESIPAKVDMNSIYLNRSFLRKPREIRKYLDINEPNREQIKIETEDGYYVYGELFNRNSDTLLVVGSGWPTPREKMVPFLSLFPEYDVLFIDYVGQGLDHIAKTWIGSLSYRLANVDICATHLGSTDEVDVIKLINEVKQRKKYNHSYGLALCYSASIFIKSSIIESTLFEKIIIDGCWPSTKHVIKEIACHPSLAFNVQSPRSPCRFITDREWFQNFVCYLAEMLTMVKLSDIESIDYYLPNLGNGAKSTVF